MKYKVAYLTILTLLSGNVYSQELMKYNDLTPEEEKVIIHKGTERAFTGEYNDHKANGYYTCKRCNAYLYKSKDKFESHCGWPSFDDEIEGAVKRLPDADGKRTEIICSRCNGHLGHIFLNEGFTAKNTRHCVNSISLNFVTDKNIQEEKAYFAGGCFWGIEYYFQQVKGVVSTEVGYMGGRTENPTYKEVSHKNTGHIETMQVIYNAKEVSYEELAKLFFEIHDPTQVNRQGPDVGEQYRSEIFYVDDTQKATAENLIEILKKKNLKIATLLTKANKFWKAENYHQDYYKKNGETPYCHSYIKSFNAKMDNFLDVLQGSISPIILISGVGLLLLSLTNRLGRTIDRTRVLVRELRENTDEDYQKRKKLQLKIMYRRSKILKNSIAAISVSILCSSLIIFNLLIMNLTNLNLQMLGLVIFVMNIASIVFSAIYLLIDVLLTLKALKHEVNGFLPKVG